MKTQVSALDIHYILKELQYLKDSRIQKIYNPEKKELIIQTHTTSQGSSFIRFQVPNVFYKAEKKQESGEPSGFCMFLRKHLTNSKITNIEQIDFERIVKLELQTKEGIKNLYFEFLDKGNIILTDNNNTIISAEEQQTWSNRKIAPKETYTYPKKDYNLLTITLEQLTTVLKGSQETSIVKTLAKNLGLGGIYAEHIIEKSKIDKSINPTNLNEKETHNILKQIKDITNQDIYPTKQDKEIYPIAIAKENAEKTFNQTLDKIFSIEKKIETKNEKEIKKINIIIDEQRKTLQKTIEKEEEYRKIGEYIYNDFQRIEEAIRRIEEISKLPKDQLKRILKTLPKIKEIDQKEKTVIVEL